MSNDGGDHTSVINATLTELAFLLIYGFMLTGAAVGSGQTQADTTGGASDKDKEIGRLKGEIEILTKKICKSGETVINGECVKADYHSNACYKPKNKSGNSSERAVINILWLHNDRVEFRYTADPSALADQELLDKQNENILRELQRTSDKVGPVLVTSIDKFNSIVNRLSEIGEKRLNKCSFSFSYYAKDDWRYDRKQYDIIRHKLNEIPSTLTLPQAKP